MKKRIGILTTGGDCSGLNSVIRAAFIRAKNLGYELLGLKRGIRGLTNPIDCITLTSDICDESMLANSGSIILSDTKWMSSAIEAGKTIDDIKNMIYVGYNNLGLDGLICIGGDGSLRLINELLIKNENLNIAFVPKTIDNDVNYTDYAVGFQTAVEVVVSAIENIRSTAKSHERTMVVEVMGRDAGFIAMYAGVAAGADVILVPEFKYDLEELKNKVKSCFANGKNHCIIVVAESVEDEDFKHTVENVNGIMKFSHLEYRGIGQHLVRKIKEIGIESRCVTLGHIQRGGRTCINDRLLGTLFGVEAINLIDKKISGKVLTFSENKLKTLDMSDVIQHVNKVLDPNDDYVKIAKDLGVYIGEI